jgi:hypothetical protein
MHAVIKIIFYIYKIIFASTQVQKMAKFERKHQNYDEKLCGNKQKLLIFESLTDTLNFRTVCYYLTNLINDPSSLSMHNNHIIFNVGTPSVEARHIRLVSIVTPMIEESKLI